MSQFRYIIDMAQSLRIVCTVLYFIRAADVRQSDWVKVEGPHFSDPT